MTDQQRDLSPVFERRGSARPGVRQRSSRWTVPAALGGALALGGLVYSSLSQTREEAPPVAAAPAAATSPSALAPAPPSPSLGLSFPVDAPMAFGPILAGPDENQGWRSAALVIDQGEAAPAPPAPAAAAAERPQGGREAGGLTPEERFMATVRATDAARASRLADLARTVPQGTIISAVLETAIDSDLPGSVRAVVSRDVRGFDGGRVLIPRGSKLVGQYKSSVALGQTRAFVVWSRVLTPEGVSVDIASPATDRLGRGGLDGDIDTHFFRRFGSAILLSVITGAVEGTARRGSDPTVVIGSPAQASRVAEIALQKQIDIPPTIRVPQGAAVQVFVSRDLDFSEVEP